MKKPRTWRIDNPVYRYAMFLRVDGDLDRARRWAEKQLGTQLSKASRDSTYGRIFLPDDSADHAIVFRDRPGGGVAAHEALHAVCHVMNQRGMEPMTPANDEAYCYLLQWTVAEIGKRVW
jgi:hypothetical protein